MINDALITFKTLQKKSWELFAPLEIFTTIPAANLVKFSRLHSGHTVLDIGCGTGVIAITAARLGAIVSAIDLSPALLEYAQTNISIANVSIDLQEGDAEAIPYPNSSFDVVLSQFGHMFAPRPQITAQEILRVLKPGGIIAFSTWPSHLFVGRLFDLVSQFSPLPPDVSSPSQWGTVDFIKKQFGNEVKDWIFDQAIMHYPALSREHYRLSIEKTIGPVVKFIQDSKNNPDQLSRFRNELEALILQYFSDNQIRQHYLMSRAQKKGL